MSYQRKTQDEWQIRQLTADGWEVVDYADCWKDAREIKRIYQDNQPQYPIRCVKVRIPIETEIQ